MILDRDYLEVRVPEFWPLVGPSFIGTTVEIIGPSLKLLGLGGPKKCFLTHIPSVGKESWFAREGEMSDTTLVRNDKVCGRISHDVTWWCIVVGTEI